jgi:hypothetical protein
MNRQHTIDAELTSPTPREVRYRDGFRTGCGAWAGRLILLPHTIAGLFLLVAALTLTVQYVRIGLFGLEVDGRIVQKTSYKGGKGGWYYGVDYTYTVDGVTYRQRSSVNHDAYDRMTEGDAVAIRALESDPETGHWARLPGKSALLDMLVPWAMAVFWNSIMCVFLWPLYVRPTRYRRLVRMGEPVAGTVLDVSRRNTRPASWKVTYAYPIPNPDGLTRTMRTTAMVIARPTTLEPGTSVTVLYDPAKPTRSVVYALTPYRAV